MHHRTRHGFHDFIAFIKHSFVATHHDRHSAVDGFWFTTGDRRIEHRDLFSGQRLTDFTTCQRRDRTHVDENGARTSAFNQTIFAQRHVSHLRRVWQHGDDHIRNRSHRFWCVCGCRAELDNFADGILIAVHNDQLVTCFQQVFAHRLAHDA
ncbi:hypothetical protein SRABI106_00771 [Rahnella aquatilis]|nr:hypothetical protein SRABI106_00771 [Rahnella aquatilis]